MLYDAFDTPNRMPIIRWQKSGVEVASGNSLVAELGSLSLEFTRLSQLTGNPKFYDAVQRITDEFDKQQNETRLPGLWPVRVNAREISFREDNTFSLGAMSDSIYEYLVKVRRFRKTMNAVLTSPGTSSPRRPHHPIQPFIRNRFTSDETASLLPPHDPRKP